MSKARGLALATVLSVLFGFSASAGAATAIIDDFSVDTGTPNVFTSDFSEGPESGVGSLSADRTVTGTFSNPFADPSVSTVDFSGPDLTVAVPGTEQQWVLDLDYDLGSGVNLSAAGDFEIDLDIDGGTRLLDLTIELFDGAISEARVFPGLPIDTGLTGDFLATVALPKTDFVSVDLSAIQLLTLKLDVRGPGGLTFHADNLRTTVPEPALTLLFGLALAGVLARRSLR